MTHFLKSDSNPDGRRLEDILIELRADVLVRCTKISGDLRPEALKVLSNNMQVLQHLTAAGIRRRCRAAYRRGLTTTSGQDCLDRLPCLTGQGERAPWPETSSSSPEPACRLKAGSAPSAIRTECGRSLTR